MKLKQYPKYKKSELPWIEQLPNHWEVLPNRAVFEERNTRGMDEEELLSVTIKRGVIRQKELIESSSKKDSSNEDKSKYKLVLEGDLPYNKMRMWQGAVGVSKYRGIVSPAYIILKPRKNAYSEYYHYLLRTTEYTKESHRYSYGICDDQLSLRFKDFKIIKSVVPPIDEQKNIALFLRAKEKKIAQFIRNKRRLIQLLKEQKQAIINQSVTRGINSDAKMKPSGIDWLGDIPVHWDVRRLRTIAFVRPSGVDKNIIDGEISVKLCNYVDVYKNEKITDSIEFMDGTATQEEINKFQIEEGDVLITKDSEMWNDIAVPAYIPKTLSGVICAYHLAVVRPLNMNGEFLFRAFLAESVADQFRVTANGVTRYGLSQGAIKDAWFPIPPKEEQSEIVDYINDNVSKIHLAIEKANKEIDLIQEYRTRLISDVVIGKVDVRDIKVEDVTYEEITDDLDSSEDEQELDDSVEEVFDEE
jgi:type I restriction enzyme, S subunit